MAASVALRSTARHARNVDPILVLPLVAAEILALAWYGLGHELESWRVAADLAVALAFAAAGFTALCRAGPRTPGRLMVGIALTWSLSYFQLSGSSGAWILGWLLANLPTVLIVWLLLSYPEGRLWSRAARATVMATGIAVAGGALSTVFLDPDASSLLSPGNLQLENLIGQATAALGLCVAGATTGLIAVRLIRLPAARRRLALPLLVGGLLTVPTTVVWLAAQANADWDFANSFLSVDRIVSILIPLGYFTGLAWTRIRRSGVSSLVVDLQEGGATTLRDRLARTLGDPSLDVAYWIGGDRGWVDGDGRTVELPEPGERAVTQVTASGAPVAALVHDPALLEDPDLVRSVAATAGLVLENERLAAEVRAQLAEVRASRARIVEATDAERQRLERDLHDGAQQRLVGLSLRLRLAQAGASDPDAVASLVAAQDDLEQALAELREFARGIHPTVLREDGLDAGLESLARRAPLPVEIEGESGDRLPATIELAAYFFVSEALTNVAKHASATHATVTLWRDDSLLRIAVADDGVGGVDPSAGSGLRGLVDRLAAIDGTLTATSAPGEGTTLMAEIPCGS